MHDDNLCVRIQDCIDYLTEELRQIDIMLGGILTEDYKKYILKKQMIFKILLTLIQKTENI